MMSSDSINRLVAALLCHPERSEGSLSRRHSERFLAPAFAKATVGKALGMTALVISLTFVVGTPALAANVEEIYETSCASCHGKALEGGKGGGSALNDGKWQCGSSDDAITTFIAEGQPELGVEGWKERLTREQIRSLVIFIREQEAAVANARTVFPVPSEDKVTRTQRQAYRIETLIAKGLTTPWALAFLPDGRKLITELPGTLREITEDWKLLPKPVEGTPGVIAHGQGGLMEVAPHPGWSTNGWIYLGLSDGWRDKDRPHCLTAYARGRLHDGQWIDNEWIYRADRKFYSSGGPHFGTRIVFADGYIYFVVGERGGGMEAQDLTRPNGKIFRLFDDGRVPPDNPFVGRPDAIPGIWSYGHRNPQGLDRETATGDLYATEHGPRGGDELNWIRPGCNYGWPVITFGMNYDGTPMTYKTAAEGMEQPVKYWLPSIAACGLDFYEGDRFANWHGDLFAGSLRAQELHRLRIRDHHVIEDEIVLKGIGRVRDVTDGPDGLIYVVLNEPDKVIRLIPEQPGE